MKRSLCSWLQVLKLLHPALEQLLLLFLVVIGVLVLGAPFLCCGGFGLLIWGVAKAPVEAAVRAVNEDERAIEKIGSPIKKSDSGYSVGNFHVENDHGEAEVRRFGVRGPNGSATVSGKMRMDGGGWHAEALKVEFDDGSYIDIPPLEE